uniref:Secreted protein n=1 Tax=Ascaris lumbricoides TaxID=6252 RepID=A0A0M3HU02_ASCLU
MLMLLFVISLFLNASALASIIALLIALIQCVSRCKQKRPIQDGDAHLKQPGCATADRIESSASSLLKNARCLQTRNSSNRIPGPSLDVSGTGSQPSSLHEEKTQQTGPDDQYVQLFYLLPLISLQGTP